MWFGMWPWILREGREEREAAVSLAFSTEDLISACYDSFLERIWRWQSCCGVSLCMTVIRKLNFGDQNYSETMLGHCPSRWSGTMPMGIGGSSSVDMTIFQRLRRWNNVISTPSEPPVSSAISDCPRATDFVECGTSLLVNVGGLLGEGGLAGSVLGCLWGIYSLWKLWWVVTAKSEKGLGRFW